MPAIEGVYAAPITPRRKGGEEIDLAAYWSLIDFLCSKKVDGLVLLGSTGEFLHFSMEERIRMVPLAVKRSRVPVLVNVSHSTVDGAIALAQAAVNARAAGLLLMPPYFYRYADDEIREFYRAFRQDVSQQVPVLLYNIPQFGNGISPQLAAELLRSGYDGIKDSSGDMPHFNQMRDLVGESSWVMGSDNLFTQARPNAAHAVVSGCASAIPELVISLDRALVSGDSARATQLNQRLQEFLQRIDELPFPLGINFAVACRGLKTGHPAIKVDPAKEAAFKHWFQTWWPSVEKESAQ